jgi:hypothetical protein
LLFALEMPLTTFAKFDLYFSNQNKISKFDGKN